MMLTRTRWMLLPAVAAGWLMAAAPATAALVAEVRDDGNFFKPDAVRKANEIIKQIKDRHGKDLVIETYKEIPQDRKGDYRDESKAKFFDEWAQSRARSLEVNGVYVLICKDPSYLEVEVGNETRKKAFTTENRNHLRDLLLKRFKAKEYDQGLIEGATYVRDTLDQNLGKKEERKEERRQEAGGGWLSGIGGWICLALVVGLCVWVGIALIRALSGWGGGYAGGPGYGGGGFFSSMLGGLFGAAAGMWLYSTFFGGPGGWGSSSAYGSDSGGAGADDGSGAGAQDTDYSGSGGDFGTDGGGGGGDFGDAGGGGGDFGGGDIGGGGGDF